MRAHRERLPGVAVLALTTMAAGAAGAESGPGPFVFTATPASRSPPSESWTVDHEAGYGKRALEPFGLDGIGPRLAAQGALRHGWTVLAQAGVDRAALEPRPVGTTDALHGARVLWSTAPQVELLRDLTGSRPLRLGVGLG